MRAVENLLDIVLNLLRERLPIEREWFYVVPDHGSNERVVHVLVLEGEDTEVHVFSDSENTVSIDVLRVVTGAFVCSYADVDEQIQFMLDIGLGDGRK